MSKKIEIRELQLFGRRPFPGHGSDLRRSVTALFKDRPLFHNHNPDGSSAYSIPKVRYLVDQGSAKLVSLLDGNQELDRLYERFEDADICLDIRGKAFPVEEVVLISRKASIGTLEQRVCYRSLTPWLGLNSANSRIFNRLTPLKKKDFLSNLFTANVISLAKSLDLWISDRIDSAILAFDERPISSGNIGMLGIQCSVASNVVLDPFFGLGKMVSKGFGRFERRENSQLEQGHA